MASGIMAIVVKLIYTNFNFIFSFIKEGFFANAMAILISMAFAILTYFFILVLIGGITKEDLEGLPRKITKLIPVHILKRIR
jgi:stage V sporulation protein B